VPEPSEERIFEVVWEWDDRDAQLWFDYAGHRSRRPRDPVVRAANIIRHHVNLTFDTEGDWIGHPWHELTKGYAKSKLQHWGERPILVASGEMRRKAIGRGAVQHYIDSAEGGEITYQVDSPYAWYHQDGFHVWRTVLDDDGKALRDGAGETIKEQAFIEPRPIWGDEEAVVFQIDAVFAEWLDEIKHRNVRRRSLDLPNPIEQR